MLKSDGSYSTLGEKWLSLLSSNSMKDSEKLTEIKVFAGYEEGNVQWVHKDINIMKNRYAQDYFISLCILVVNKNT